jgi:Uma2 family endonuclease
MMATRIVLTYADYAAIPADGRRYELHEGEVSVTPASGTRHQRVVGNLFVALREHVTARGLGEVFVSPIDCILSDTSVVQPDIVYVATARGSVVRERGIEGVPTLVVEVLSPSTVQIDGGVKRQLYARHGIPYYWIVDPDARRIEAYLLAEGAYRPADPGAFPPFAGLSLDSAAIWPAP